MIHFGSLTRGSAVDSTGDADHDGYTDLEEFFNATNPQDGQPIVLVGDLNQDGSVGSLDAVLLLQGWLAPGNDLNADGWVNSLDFGQLARNWGQEKR